MQKTRNLTQKIVLIALLSGLAHGQEIELIRVVAVGTPTKSGIGTLINSKPPQILTAKTLTSNATGLVLSYSGRSIAIARWAENRNVNISAIPVPEGFPLPEPLEVGKDKPSPQEGTLAEGTPILDSKGKLIGIETNTKAVSTAALRNTQEWVWGETPLREREWHAFAECVETLPKNLQGTLEKVFARGSPKQRPWLAVYKIQTREARIGIQETQTKIARILGGINWLKPNQNLAEFRKEIKILEENTNNFEVLSWGQLQKNFNGEIALEEYHRTKSKLVHIREFIELGRKAIRNSEAFQERIRLKTATVEDKKILERTVAALPRSLTIASTIWLKEEQDSA